MDHVDRVKNLDRSGSGGSESSQRETSDPSDPTPIQKAIQPISHSNAESGGVIQPIHDIQRSTPIHGTNVDVEPLGTAQNDFADWRNIPVVDFASLPDEDLTGKVRTATWRDIVLTYAPGGEWEGMWLVAVQNTGRFLGSFPTQQKAIAFARQCRAAEREE